MKTPGFFYALIVLAMALPAVATENPLLWRGSAGTDQRLFLEEGREWAWNETRLDLTMEKRMRPLRVVSNVWIRHLGPSVVNESADLFRKEKVSPWSLDIRELYAEVHGLFHDDLDMKIGRQHIAWGRADQFNPTNNLNPFDLEDVLDFGRTLGVDALSLQWHFTHQSALQVVYVPRFQPANMPVGPFFDLLAAPFPIPDIKPTPTLTDSIILPSNNFQEGSNVGLRWRGFAANTDFSISYLYGRDPLSLPNAVTLGVNPGTGIPNIHATLIYPRRHVFGADMAGAIGSVGVWAELAVFLPESETRMTIHVPAHLNVDIPASETVLKKEPYARYVVGADYTFRNGSYLNAQYLKGFFHERGRDEASDYLFLHINRYAMQNRLRIQVISGALSVSDRKDMANSFSWLYAPEITYLGVQNLEMTVGGFFFDGKGDSIFSVMKDKNMLRIAVKAVF